MTDAATLPRTAPPEEVMREAVELLARQWVVVLATVVARRGSTPSTPGQKLLLSSPAVTSASAALAVGTIGGGAIELRVLARMRQMLGGPPSPPGIETFDLGSALGMCCGGSVDVLFERLEPALSVLVVGAGHIGASLAPLCAGLGFRTVVCDQREGAAERVVGREGVQASGRPVVVLPLEHDDPEVLDAVGDPVAAAALVMTHDHQLDQAAIEWALARRFAFVGGVGSRAKAARTQARLEAKGVAQVDIERVRMPLGVVVGARSPLEIAVAIAAELVAWRAERHGSARVRAPLAGSRTGDPPGGGGAPPPPGPPGHPDPPFPASAPTASAPLRRRVSCRASAGQRARTRRVELMSSAPPPLAAVVLAAGRGARMGGPKALLAWPSQGGTTAVVPLAIAHARARLDGDCETVTLVVEPAVADRLDAWLASDRGTALPRARLYIVRACPPDPAGSIAAALLHGRLAPLVLLTPVDCPPARADTVSLLVSRLASDSHIVAARPVAQGRRGHPVILRREVLSPAFDAPSPPPLREHLQALGARVADVAVADPHVWADLDSPASLAALGLGEPSFL